MMFTIKKEVGSRLPSLIGAAPDVFNTIVELAAALGHDQNYATTIHNQITSKADKLTTYSKN